MTEAISLPTDRHTPFAMTTLSTLVMTKKNKFAMTIAMANELDSLLKQGNKVLFYFILLEIRSGIQDVHSNNAGLRHLEQRHLISLRHHQKNRL